MVDQHLVPRPSPLRIRAARQSPSPLREGLSTRRAYPVRGTRAMAAGQANTGAKIARRSAISEGSARKARAALRAQGRVVPRAPGPIRHGLRSKLAVSKKTEEPAREQAHGAYSSTRLMEPRLNQIMQQFFTGV